MQYNYDFEIASLLIMIIILLHFLFVRQFPVDKTKVFGMLLLSCTAECFVNILSCIGLENADLVPRIVNEILAFVFFLLEGLSAYLVSRYFMVICEFKGRTKKIIGLLGAVPFGAFLLCLLLTSVTGFFYYFVDGTYYQGFGAGFVYVYTAYYFLLNMMLVVRRYKVVSLRTKIIIGIYITVAVSMLILQYQVRGVLLTSVGNAVILLMVYLAMQNPSELLDPVTKVGNERAFLAQMKNILGHRSRMTLITVRLRQFHHIHGILGIDNSELLLQDVGTYLYQLCGKFHVFRTSTDTFTVLAETEEQADMIRGSIEEKFSQDWVIQQNHIVLDMDMVVQHYPEDFQSIPEYMGMRQFLLERATASGTQAVIESDAAIMEQYRRRSKVELAIAQAIREKSFEIFYQPIYSVEERSIVSLEALVRLKDEELGFIPPDEFFSLAERDGNVIHIGEQTLEECCKFLSQHVLSNESLGIRTIQINISMVQCLRQNLSETIIPVLERYHIPPSMITLELTERTAISAPERLKRHMKELGELGINFAVDDYGSGNSNFSYLIQFPFKEVKIDKEIATAYFNNDTAKVILENEIQTMRKLGIPLVVEGIETKEQSEEMQRLGVDYIQGYYYGKPLPQKECLRHIRRFNSNLEDLF